MLQVEHSAILSTFIKLPIVIKIFVLSIFEWPFYTGFTVVYFHDKGFMLNSNHGMTNRAATDKMSLSVTHTLFGHCNTLIFRDRNILATQPCGV